MPLKVSFFRTSFTIGLATVAISSALYLGGSKEASAGKPRISKQSADSLTAIGKAMAEISAAIKPAIVNISTLRTGKGSDLFAEDPFLRRFFDDRFRQPPSEKRSAALGSGVIVSPDGYIITNYHVVKDADKIKVLLSDRREFAGKVIGSDPKTELSVVKIEAGDLPTLSWGDSDSLEVGDLVLAVGNPYGLNQTVTLGIVSAVGRANVGIADYEDFIQTDAAINPGNSGGALVNVRGQLVGINTAIFSTSGGYQGIGFAIPSNMVKAIVESLIRSGEVVRGWLGISIQPVTRDLAKQFDLKDESGVLVSEVTENSPAEKAGLMRGDVIVEYDRRKTDEPSQFRNMVAGTVPGEEHSLSVLRDGKMLRLNVIIGELPSEMQQAESGTYENALRGVGVQNVTPDIARKLDLPARVNGVIVNDIDEGGPAYGVLARGDVIQEINRDQITSVKDYRAAVSGIGEGENILLLIYRGKASLFITLSPG